MPVMLSGKNSQRMHLQELFHKTPAVQEVLSRIVGIFPTLIGRGPLIPSSHTTSTIASSCILAIAPLFSTIK